MNRRFAASSVKSPGRFDTWRNGFAAHRSDVELRLDVFR
jgi:hypothetical protein